MVDFIGERFSETATLPGEWITIPPAAVSHLRDGRPLDAEVAMVLHQNASHAACETPRELFTWVRGGAALSQVDGWSGVVDAGSQSGTTGLAGISWSLETVARRWGPFFGVEDRATDDGAPVLRKVVVETEAMSGVGGSLTITIAITGGLTADPPYASALTFATFSPGTTLTQTSTVLTVEAPMTASTVMRARPTSSALGLAEVTILPYWVWVGWRSTSLSDRILTVCANEGR